MLLNVKKQLELKICDIAVKHCDWKPVMTNNKSSKITKKYINCLKKLLNAKFTDLVKSQKQYPFNNYHKIAMEFLKIINNLIESRNKKQ